MMKLFRFLFVMAGLIFAGVSVLLVLLWSVGFMQDEELSPEAVAILEILETPAVSSETNRFYYFYGFESPSSYEPHVWAKMWLDEQKRFYGNPENISNEFDFYREQQDFKSSDTAVKMLKAEVESYGTLWEGVDELFSQINEDTFSVKLMEYFSSSENHDKSVNMDLSQGKRNMFVKRYKHGRTLQQSTPVIIENFRASRLSSHMAVLKCHNYMLLELCDQFVNGANELYKKDVILSELLLDFSNLHQWLQSSNEMVEYSVTRRMLTDTMEVSLFLLNEMKRNGMILVGNNELHRAVYESGELLQQFIPREAIASEFKAIGVQMDLWAQSQQHLRTYIDVTEEMMELFGGGVYHPPVLVRMLLSCPERLYPLVVKVVLKANYTQNLVAGEFQILLDMAMVEDNPERVRGLIENRVRSVGTNYNWLYNPLGTLLLQEPGQLGIHSTALMVYNFLSSSHFFRRVEKIMEKV